MDRPAVEPGTGRAFFLLSPEPLPECFFGIQEFPGSRTGIKVRYKSYSPYHLLLLEVTITY